MDFEAQKQKIRAAFPPGRMPHAVLITGGAACDRHTLSMFLAQTAVCTSAHKPCGTCAACKKTIGMAHPDITVLEGTGTARSLHVDEIRGIRRAAYAVPNESEKKVFIITNAQSMSEQAQNALLKILEEPPPYVLFLLSCPNMSVLLPTVISRAALWSLGMAEDVGGADEKQMLAREIAGQIADAAARRDEMRVMAQAGRLEKDKYLLTLTLEALVSVFRSALRGKAEGGLKAQNAEPTPLLENLTVPQLLALSEGAMRLRASAEKNANQTLLLTRISSTLHI
jgi:DNA polymerase-3 subunit delta'